MAKIVNMQSAITKLLKVRYMFTFNPVTGCRTGCEYCYAAKQAKRFSGDVRINKGSAQLQKDNDGSGGKT